MGHPSLPAGYPLLEPVEGLAYYFLLPVRLAPVPDMILGSLVVRGPLLLDIYQVRNTVSVNRPETDGCEQGSSEVTQTDVTTELDRPRRGLLIGAAVAAAVIVIGGLIWVLQGDDAPVTQQPATPTEIATAYVEAAASFDTDQYVSYLAEDAELPWPGDLEGMRLYDRLREAQGFKFMLEPCEEVSSSAVGTTVRCPYDYHAFRSDEIGLGPFRGSYFGFLIRDGKILRDIGLPALDEFGAQMWVPFAIWVAESHPDDVTIMWMDSSQTLERISEESIQLWEQHIRSYAQQAGNS